MIQVKLNSSGYTKRYSDGRNVSMVGDYTQDEEASTFLEEGGVIDPEFTLDDIMAQQKEAIKQAFTNAIASGYTINLIHMDADVNDMFLLEEGIKFIEAIPLTDIEITDKNNVDHIVSVATAKTILQELKQNFFTQRSKKRTLQNQIDGIDVLSATAEADIKAVVW